MLQRKRNGEESERDNKKHGWLTSALIQRTTDDVSLSIRLIWLFVWMVFLCISFTIGRSRQSQRNGNDTMYIASLTTCLLKKTHTNNKIKRPNPRRKTKQFHLLSWTFQTEFTFIAAVFTVTTHSISWHFVAAWFFFWFVCEISVLYFILFFICSVLCCVVCHPLLLWTVDVDLCIILSNGIACIVGSEGDRTYIQ